MILGTMWSVAYQNEVAVWVKNSRAVRGHSFRDLLANAYI